MNRTRVSIRPAVFLDAINIFKLGFKTLRAGNEPLYRTFTLKEVEHHLKAEAKYCFVAVDAENNIIGFVLAAKHFEDCPKYGHIEWAVSEKKGCGKVLAGYAQKTLFADGVYLSVCEVCSKNTKCENGIKSQGGFVFDTKYFYSEERCGLVTLCEPVQTVHLYLVSNKI